MQQRPNGADLESVQYLRGIAASMVVFHHALEQIPGFHQLFPSRAGAMGVDIFFVISGFVMTYTTARANYSAGAFLVRRAVRIVPLYWIMTALVAVLLYFAANLVNNSRFTFESFVLSLLFIPHHNPGLENSITPMLKLGWTLNFEVFFYLVFASVIWMRPVARTLLLGVVFGALLVFVRTVEPNWAPLLFWGNSLLLEFVLGCAIAILYARGALTALPIWLWLVVLTGAVGAMLVIGFEPMPYVWRWIIYGVPATLVLTATLGLEQTTHKPWKSRLLRLLGDASYSIYLAHLYIVVAFRIAWQRFDLPATGPFYAIAFMLGCVSIGIAAGLITYKFIEKPITDWVRGWATPRRQLTVA